MAGDCDYGGDFGDAEALTDEFGGYEAGRSGDDELHCLKCSCWLPLFKVERGSVRNGIEDKVICVLFGFHK